MDRYSADQMLATIGAAYDRLSAGMYAVDSHDGLGFLRAGVHTGATERVWADLRPRIDALWAQFSTLGDLLEEARSLRAAHRPGDPEWVRLTGLLTAPVVSLDADGMPGPPALLPPAQPASPAWRGWPPAPLAVVPAVPAQPRPVGYPPASTAALRTVDLAARMEVACAAALRTLGDVNAAWGTASMVSAPLTEAVARAVTLAADVNDPEPATDLAHRADLLRDQIVSDPVGSAPHGVLDHRWRATLEARHDEATALAAHLRAQARIRDGYDQRLAILTAAVDAAATAETRAGTAFAQATAKVADTGLPDAPHSADLLRRELGELDRTRARAPGLRGGWGLLATGADRLEQAAARAAERAAELTAAAEGLVGRRDELRGRLEAYRVKAAEHALDEHDELTALHREARILLYTAPCDLPAATRAVFAYQSRLAGLLEAGNGRRRSR
jgi:hypothetical protein